MLLEAFQFLTTPSSAISRKLGYLKQAIALEARYHRCQLAWSKHLNNSQDLIRSAMNECLQHRKVVVLGSGLLLDIPIEDLSARFDQVELIDMVHLRTARKRVNTFHNVHLIEFDITGVTPTLAMLKTSDSETQWPEPFCDIRQFEGTDLVISANVLSQLSLLPGDYLARLGWRDHNMIQRYKRAIVDHHLVLLNHLVDQLACTVCFIADIERRILTDSQPIQVEDLLLGAKPLTDASSWMWNFAPAPEVNRTTNIHHQVVGGILSASAASSAS